MIKKLNYISLLSLFLIILAGCGTESTHGNESTVNISPTTIESPIASNPTNEPLIVPQTPKPTETIKTPTYSIVMKDDISTGSAQRFSYYVVPKDVMSITEDDIKIISSDVVQKAKTDQPFSAISIFFMDDQRAIKVGDPYTIAKTEYAPNGIWTNALLATPGEYKNFDYKYYLGSSMSGKLPKANDHYPSPAELDIYFYYMDIHKKGLEEIEAYKQSAEKYKISVDDVKAIVLKGISR